ncbi:hypothetical protein Trydic_g2208 [Trypoxylus dichotomus]
MLFSPLYAKGAAGSGKATTDTDAGFYYSNVSRLFSCDFSSAPRHAEFSILRDDCAARRRVGARLFLTVAALVSISDTLFRFVYFIDIYANSVVNLIDFSEIELNGKLFNPEENQ